MATVYSKQILSGSTNGRMVEVNASASPGTTIHTVQATATTSREEVWMYVVNSATATTATGTHQITVELGGTGTADHLVYSVPAQNGLHLLVPGVTFTATTSIIRAFGTATGIHHIAGWVNRAT